MNETLTNENIEEIVNTVEDIRNSTTDMIKIKENTNINEDADLIADTVFTPINPSASDIMLSQINNNDNNSIDNAKKSFDLTDEEASDFLECVSKMADNPNYPVFNHLPKKMKNMITKSMMENNIPSSHSNEVARMLIDEFMSDIKEDELFDDLQKAIDEAMNMPSFGDMYSEYSKETIEDRIPKIIEDVKDKYPEKAETLSSVREVFIKSYTFELAKNAYNNNSKIRKAVRRYDTELKRTLNDFNFKNEKSTFKVSDILQLPDILKIVLIEQPKNVSESKMNDLYNKILDMNITDVDISKFCIYICKSCENMDPTNIVDASYMYYLTKNILMLKHTQDAKTNFSAELINNICDSIAFIRNKEAEFYASNMDKSKSTKKLHTNNCK